MPAKIASSMAGRPAVVPGILMNRFGTPGSGKQLFGRGEGAGRVVSQERRHFQRHPPVHTIRPVVGGSKQVGSAGEVLQCQLEEQGVPRRALRELLADGSIIGRAVLDGLVEDRRIRGEPRHRQLVDVALERAAVQQVARDVVEPEALTQVVEYVRRLHRVTSIGNPAHPAERDVLSGHRVWSFVLVMSGCRATSMTLERGLTWYVCGGSKGSSSPST